LVVISRKRSNLRQEWQTARYKHIDACNCRSQRCCINLRIMHCMQGRAVTTDCASHACVLVKLHVVMFAASACAAHHHQPCCCRMSSCTRSLQGTKGMLQPKHTAQNADSKSLAVRTHIARHDSSQACAMVHAGCVSEASPTAWTNPGAMLTGQLT